MNWAAFFSVLLAGLAVGVVTVIGLFLGIHSQRIVEWMTRGRIVDEFLCFMLIFWTYALLVVATFIGAIS